jgi:hypothetical protein
VNPGRVTHSQAGRDLQFIGMMGGVQVVGETGQPLLALPSAPIVPATHLFAPESEAPLGDISSPGRGPQGKKRGRAGSLSDMQQPQRESLPQAQDIRRGRDRQPPAGTDGRWRLGMGATEGGL